MHIFLTGEIQIGKSAVRKKVCQRLAGADLRGFVTEKRILSGDEAPGVYIFPVNGKKEYCDENRVGIGCTSRTRAVAFPAVFDLRGIEILRDAEGGDLILMDEIGKMESGAPLFSARILQLLSQSTPVLGVVRKEGDTPLLNAVRTYPNVKLIEITKENRDTIADEIFDMLDRIGP